MTGRGRPTTRSRAGRANQDAVVASAAHQLLCWGFPRKVAFDAIAKCTDDFFGAARSAIGSPGVKRIYDRWVVRQRNPWHLKYGAVDHLPAAPTSFVFRPSAYTRQSLRRALRPKGALSDLARLLLDNGGAWPEQGEVLVQGMWLLEPSHALDSFHAKYWLKTRWTRGFERPKRARGRPKKNSKRGT